jgi:hypothetical protein
MLKIVEDLDAVELRLEDGRWVKCISLSSGDSSLCRDRAKCAFGSSCAGKGRFATALGLSSRRHDVCRSEMLSSPSMPAMLRMARSLSSGKIRRVARRLVRYTA